MRKARRPDWRQKPAKRTIPAMSRRQLLLRGCRVTMVVTPETARAFDEQLLAAAWLMAPRVGRSVYQVKDELAIAMAKYSNMYYPMAPAFDSKGKIMSISLARTHDQQSVIGD